mmetsp:Transcript_18730/g.39388  ORF Transcript_18730/g.39388 Transcript_18730/m.39388 type:complete len:231 (+) Transcript_18730:201-893(+)
MTRLRLRLRLPLFANTRSPAFSPPTASFSDPGREPRRIKGPEVYALGRAVQNQFRHDLSAGRCPGNSPAVVPGIDKGVGVGGNLPHIWKGVGWAGPHAGLCPVQFTLFLVHTGEFPEAVGGRLDAGIVRFDDLPEGSLLEFVRGDVIRSTYPTDVNSSIGPGVDLQVCVESVVFSAKQCRGIHVFYLVGLLPNDAGAFHSLHRQLDARSLEPILGLARPGSRRNHHRIGR